MMRSWIADSSGTYFFMPRIAFIGIFMPILPAAGAAMPIFFAAGIPIFFAAAIRTSYLALLRAEIAFAFARASGLLDAPHACSDNSRRVGSPFGLRSGPGVPPIRAKNDARLGRSEEHTSELQSPY